MAECWSCGAERGDASFCTSCKKIQPVPKKESLFDALGLEPKMALDRSDLEKRFRERSKDVHPDRFGKTSAVERRLALEHTTRVNDAYRVLRDPRTRAEYLLELDGLKVGGEEERSDDPELLMLMMELQEKTASSDDEEELEKLLDDVTSRRRALLEKVEAYFDRKEGRREDVKKALDELRFVRRLEERIEHRLEEV